MAAVLFAEPTAVVLGCHRVDLQELFALPSTRAAPCEAPRSNRSHQPGSDHISNQYAFPAGPTFQLGCTPFQLGPHRSRTVLAVVCRLFQRHSTWFRTQQRAQLVHVCLLYALSARRLFSWALPSAELHAFQLGPRRSNTVLAVFCRLCELRSTWFRTQQRAQLSHVGLLYAFSARRPFS